jgi:hypothetical protein
MLYAHKKELAIFLILLNQGKNEYKIKFIIYCIINCFFNTVNLYNKARIFYYRSKLS